MTHTASDMHDDSESTAPLKPEALKPCPFCGESASASIRESGVYRDAIIVCYGCEAEKSTPDAWISPSEDARGLSGLAEAWNRRTPLASSRAPQQQGVKVRKLEWRDAPIPPSWECLASSSVGLYCIPLGGPTFRLTLRDKDTLGTFDTIEAAKAAAQQDYEARILSALSIQEPASEPVAECMWTDKPCTCGGGPCEQVDFGGGKSPAPAVPADLVERLRAATMGFDWRDLPDDAAIPAVPLLREAASAIASLTAANSHITAIMEGYREGMFSERHRATRAEAALARALEALRSFSIYTIEDDDGIRLSTGGLCIAHWGDHTPEGIALLKLEAHCREARDAARAFLQSQRPEQ